MPCSIHTCMHACIHAAGFARRERSRRAWRGASGPQGPRSRGHAPPRRLAQAEAQDPSQATHCGTGYNPVGTLHPRDAAAPRDQGAGARGQPADRGTGARGQPAAPASAASVAATCRVRAASLSCGPWYGTWVPYWGSRAMCVGDGLERRERHCEPRCESRRQGGDSQLEAASGCW